MFHQVLVGQRPFHGCDYNLIRSLGIIEHSPERPQWTLIPDPVWDMMELCWRREPTERPQLEEILHILASAGVSPPAEWPSPPATVSTPSMACSSPRDPDTSSPPAPLITPAVLLDPPILPTPGIPVTELPPRPHYFPLRIPVTVLHPLPYLFRNFVPRITPPAPAIPHRQVGAPSLTAITLHFMSPRPVFRRRVIGGGITKQQPGGANRRNP